MEKAYISKDEIEQLIEHEWQGCLPFLQDISKENNISLEELINENEISKPTLEDLIYYCDQVACEKYEWDRERMVNTAVATGVAAEILKLIDSRLKLNK